MGPGRNELGPERLVVELGWGRIDLIPMSRQDNYKQTIQNLHKLASNHKRPHAITNMNDNIYMNSTKASSVNARS